LERLDVLGLGRVGLLGDAPESPGVERLVGNAHEMEDEVVGVVHGHPHGLKKILTSVILSGGDAAPGCSKMT
jgi:hypothetical protein